MGLLLDNLEHFQRTMLHQSSQDVKGWLGCGVQCFTHPCPLQKLSRLGHGLLHQGPRKGQEEESMHHQAIGWGY